VTSFQRALQMHWLFRITPRQFAVKLRRRVLPNLGHLTKSRIRRCRCCERLTIFLQFSRDEEFALCIRCGANLRYELLAEYVRNRIETGRPLAVWELDPSSVLRGLLEKHAATYCRSYYSPVQLPGAVRSDGAVMQDVTRTTFTAESFDLIISSDVLEHVPDLHGAFVEMGRVLKEDGRCIFTVPTCDKTARRAALQPNGSVEHLLEPEYHSDPLNPRGILAFWSLGPDLPDRFCDSGMTFKIARGPEGVSRRIVWEAKKNANKHGALTAPTGDGDERQAIP